MIEDAVSDINPPKNIENVDTNDDFARNLLFQTSILVEIHVSFFRSVW